MSTRPKLLDLFCKAGGASVGYDEAGFDVTGVDIEPQPNYPYTFIQADALEYLKTEGHRFHAVTGSPPCQAYSVTRHVTGRTDHLRLIGPFRDLVRTTGLPYVIENVEGARTDMIRPVRLCGSAFGLRVRRHRLFETNWGMYGLPCEHRWQDDSPVYRVRIAKNRGGFRMSGVVPVFGNHQVLHGADRTCDIALETKVCGNAMGIDWMTKPELNQAIPPAYTRFIGSQLLEIVREARS